MPVAPRMTAPPYTSKVVAGAVVPIPTLPLDSKIAEFSTLHDDGVNFTTRPTLPVPSLVTLQRAEAAVGYQLAIITAIASAALNVTSPLRMFILQRVFMKVPPQLSRIF